MTIANIPAKSSAITRSVVTALLQSPLFPSIKVDDQNRANFRSTFDAMGQGLGLINSANLRLQPVAGIPCWEAQPRHQQNQDLILYFHGGGYCFGSPQSHQHLIAYLARRTGSTLLAVDYRRAPEHPFPAARDDAVKCYLKLLEQGVAADNILLAGDSAGGHLLLSLTLQLKQMQRPLPRALCCLSPWTDTSLASASIQQRAARDPLLTPQVMAEFADCFTPGLSPLQRQQAPVSPVYGDFSGFPPTLIQVGSEEVLYDDALRLYQQMLAAGVEVKLEIWEQMFHVWHYAYPNLKEGRAACQRISEFFAATGAMA